MAMMEKATTSTGSACGSLCSFSSNLWPTVRSSSTTEAMLDRERPRAQARSLGRGWSGLTQPSPLLEEEQGHLLSPLRRAARSDAKMGPSASSHTEHGEGVPFAPMMPLLVPTALPCAHWPVPVPPGSADPQVGTGWQGPGTNLELYLLPLHQGSPAGFAQGKWGCSCSMAKESCQAGGLCLSPWAVGSPPLC